MAEKEMREWITFAVAIGLLIYFGLGDIELSPVWAAMLGAMLGWGTLVRDKRPPPGPPSDSADRSQNRQDRKRRKP